MKKILAVILTLIMLLQTGITIFAEDKVNLIGRTATPVVALTGDGRSIYDENGNKAPSFYDALNSIVSSGDENSESDPSGAAKNIMTALVKGIITNDYDEYYQVMYDEVAEMTEVINLDENGEPKYGTDISAQDKAENQRKMTTPNVRSDYGYFDYNFCYDWRLDPLTVADKLDEFIEGVCAMTGHDQVALSGRCLGGNFCLAYLAKYGYKNRLKGIGFDCAMIGGQDSISEAISGKFSLDADAISRYLTDQKIENDFSVDDKVIDLIDFIEASYLDFALTETMKRTIYYKIVEGVTSALALSTLCTMPGYWSCVSERDYEDAMLYVFGPEGSEKREKYAGLIEKIENYENTVRKNENQIIKDYFDNGGNVCIVAKYGLQNVPICKSCNLVSDDMVSVRNATLGATTSEIFNTLDDKYVEKQEKAGLGKYISADRQVDLSTALLPDYTYLIKGISHSSWTSRQEQIIQAVITADRHLPSDEVNCPRFTIKDENGEYREMTAENCHTENWTAVDTENSEPASKALRFVRAFIKVIRYLIDLIKEKLAG